jgi:hypothetical protein
MLLVIEFIPASGESLESALQPVQAKLDKTLGELGFERTSSRAVMSSGMPCQEICYKLTKTHRVELETIQAEVRAIEEEVRGHTSVSRPWEITRFVELTAYLQPEPGE